MQEVTTYINKEFAQKGIDGIEEILNCLRKRIDNADKRGRVEVSPEMALWLADFFQTTNNDCLEKIKELDK